MSNHGYKRIRLDRTTTRDLHRIIMEKHLGRRLSRTEIIHHIDGDRTNNSLDNLEVMTRAAHARHHRKGKPIPGDSKGNGGARGERNATAKLKDHQVANIKELLAEGKSYKSIGILFDVDPATIRRINLGISWSHITPSV